MSAIDLLASIHSTCAQIDSTSLRNIGTLLDYKELIVCARDFQKTQTLISDRWIEDMKETTNCMNGIQLILSNVQNQFQLPAAFDYTRMLVQMDETTKAILRVVHEMESIDSSDLTTSRVHGQFKDMHALVCDVNSKFGSVHERYQSFVHGQQNQEKETLCPAKRVGACTTKLLAKHTKSVGLTRRKTCTPRKHLCHQKRRRHGCTQRANVAAYLLCRRRRQIKRALLSNRRNRTYLHRMRARLLQTPKSGNPRNWSRKRFFFESIGTRRCQR